MTGLIVAKRRAKHGVAGHSLVAAITLLYVVLGDRVSRQVGGSDLPLLAVAVVVAAWLVGLQLHPSPSRVLLTAAARSGFLPYLLLQALLPPLALLFLSAPLSALGAVLPVGLALAGLILGSLAVDGPALRRVLVWTAVPLATLVHATWAIVQAARIGGLLPSTVADASLLVDLGHVGGFTAVQVFNRSTGLLTNPNALGLWGASSFLFALQFLSGRRRTLTCSAAVLCLVTSGSRGALIAFACGLLAFGAHTGVLQRRTTATRHNRRAVARMLCIAVLCLVPVTLAVTVQGDRFAEPFTGASAITSAETDLGARVVFWKGAWQHLGQRPVGTILTPEYVLETSIDSDIFRTLAQGGAVFFGTLLLGYGTAAVQAATFPAPALLGLTTTIVVAGMTMNALLYLPSLLLWMALGMTMVPSGRGQS